MSNMSRLAVDVVLLPPDDIMDWVITINRGLKKVSKSHFLLNKTDYIPHITLAMGSINEADVPDIKKKLYEMLSKMKPVQIEFNSVKKSILPDGHYASGIVVSKTKMLQELHETVMDVMSEYFTYKGTPEMFFTPPTVERLPLSWILNFHKNSVYKKYHPHLSLGLGIPDQIKLPIKFSASRVALCHLGNYCTCRKILYETTLK